MNMRGCTLNVRSAAGTRAAAGMLRSFDKPLNGKNEIASARLSADDDLRRSTGPHIGKPSNVNFRWFNGPEPHPNHNRGRRRVNEKWRQRRRGDRGGPTKHAAVAVLLKRQAGTIMRRLAHACRQRPGLQARSAGDVMVEIRNSDLHAKREQR